jgi:hypothetical protein
MTAQLLFTAGLGRHGSAQCAACNATGVAARQAADNDISALASLLQPQQAPTSDDRRRPILQRALLDDADLLRNGARSDGVVTCSGAPMPGSEV